MIDVKCKGCNKLLAKVTIMVGAVKCSRCKMVFEYRIYTNDLFENSERDIKKIQTPPSANPQGEN